ncbi:MAG: alpha/beta hydrolase [Myxococcota bacterium]|nr:alpha/beta hydrolase [Myxococcota bacterium]
MTQLPPARRVELPTATTPTGTALDAITLSLHEAGPTDGPAVVLCHGFPELAYSWRYQVPALADAGFRVLAPDQRGYGASDCPEAIEAYSLEYLMADMVRLLDARGIEKAVFAGHDWGGFVAWGMPVAYPDRTAGVIGVNTPNVPMPRTSMMRLAVPDDEKLYILWFQEPGVAEGVLDERPSLVFEKLMRAGSAPESRQSLAERASGGGKMDANPFRRLEELPALGESILDAEELAVYVRAFEQTGFRGGINWYRNVDRNADAFPSIGTQKLELPCLMVTAEWDMALRPEMAAGMPAVCSDLEIQMIERCGHWTQQEKPDELNTILLDWLGRRFA